MNGEHDDSGDPAPSGAAPSDPAPSSAAPSGAAPRLRFGTAGIRGPLGPGPGHINRRVVHDAVAAIAAQLRDEHRADHHPDRPLVVAVGRDARHGSADLADEAVTTLRTCGVQVATFDDVVPTPLLAFAVRTLGTDAGLMITASHNPASDNGMKVYWSDGAQIVAPLDSAIEARIVDLEASGVSGPPPTAQWSTTTDGVESLGSVDEGSAVVDAYVQQVTTARRPDGRPPGPPLRTAHTALHGVGAALFERVARTAGFDSVAVTDQRDPDPDFPSVVSPNPEEPGALDALLSTATAVSAELAIALDPDADRLALAVPDGDGWRPLTGDETGALLAHHLLGVTAGRPDRFVATTVVSSRLVARMAAAQGVRHIETLTGFKWLSRPGLANPSWHQVLLYEEALGYAVGPHDRDKDGISAACCAVDAVAALRDQGRTVADLLDRLACDHGAFVTRNGSIRLDPTGTTASRIDRAPSTLGGIAVVDHDRPGPDVERWWLADDTRVIVRPSGTEPKLKYYCEALTAVREATPAGIAAARADGTTRLEAVVDDLRSSLGA